MESPKQAQWRLGGANRSNNNTPRCCRRRRVASVDVVGLRRTLDGGRLPVCRNPTKVPPQNSGSRPSSGQAGSQKDPALAIEKRSAGMCILRPRMTRSANWRCTDSISRVLYLGTEAACLCWRKRAADSSGLLLISDIGGFGEGDFPDDFSGEPLRPLQHHQEDSRRALEPRYSKFRKTAIPPSLPRPVRPASCLSSDAYVLVARRAAR